MIQYRITLEFLRENPLPLPTGEGDKEARGRVIVIGGSRETPGAALLAGVSALRAGAGKLQIATGQSVAAVIGATLPEARVIGLSETTSGDIAPTNAERLIGQIKDGDAVVLGPGMIDDQAAGALAAAILSTSSPTSFVVDAGALTGLRHHTSCFTRQAGHKVITPHAGEMATFLGIERSAVLADPAGIARRASEVTQGVVVLKGGCTHIATPAGEVWACDHGNIGLGTSGSGDTLAGIIAGLLARGTSPLLAAQWGVYMHGEAGQRLEHKQGLLGYLASEIPLEIPGIMKDIGDGA